MPSPSPEAIYDSLRIVRQLQEQLHGVTIGEIQLFAYLARLLALFRGPPSAEWGYGFARTNWGVPFSRDVAEALYQLEESGHIQKDARDEVNVLVCTEEGVNLDNMLDDLVLCQVRHVFLDAACSSSLAFPVAIIRRALLAEPTLTSANCHGTPQELLAGPSLEILCEQFVALHEVLGTETSDLLVPSAVWLSYLIEQGSEART